MNHPLSAALKESSLANAMKPRSSGSAQGEKRFEAPLVKFVHERGESISLVRAGSNSSSLHQDRPNAPGLPDHSS